ncbi:tethering factor for nuclear proteasome Sts1p [Diutina catenulata]
MMSGPVFVERRKRPRDSDEPAKMFPACAPAPGGRHKRTKVPRIHGQRLPVARMMEVMDRDQLQRMLGELMHHHPEIEDTIVHRIAPRPRVDDCIELLRQKLADVGAHLPYKCDHESDYSYLRVKPRISELLQTMSDFVLHFLPPVETDVCNSLAFLEAATSVLDDLPNFTSLEFQFTRQTAYEQLANTWMLVVSCDGDDASQAAKARQLTKMAVLDRLSRHNVFARGKFDAVIEFLKAHQSQQELVAQQGVLGDLITLDYSNYRTSAAVE